MPSKSVQKTNIPTKGKTKQKAKKTSSSKGKGKGTQLQKQVDDVVSVSVSTTTTPPTTLSTTTPTPSTLSTTTPTVVPTVVPTVPVPVSVVAVEPVLTAEVTKVISTSEQIEQDFDSIVSKINDLKNLQNSISLELRKLQKNIGRHIKDNKRKKKRVSDPNKPKRNPSGFAKPAPISSELCDFLEKPYGSEMARTDVTREITQYIKKENLQDENNRRIILPDEKLQVLMKFPKGDEPITYFNLQKYLAVHFIKKEASVPTKTI